MTKPRDPVGLVRWALGDIDLGAATNMKAFFQHETVAERLEDALAEDATVEFATPDGGFMGEMAGPFRGAEGLKQAWIEWTGIWEEWSFRGTEWIDAGKGRVLLLGDSSGRLAGSGVEIEAHAGAVYTVEGETIVRIEHFLDQDQARRAAGLGG